MRSSGVEWPILEALDTKRALKESLRPVDPFHPESASTSSPALCGRVPGDGQGAGGLDSSFYAHMKRNWTWLHLENDDRGGPAREKRSRGKKRDVEDDEEEEEEEDAEVSAL